MAATLTFQYSVRDRTGKIVAGTLEAESQAAVAGKLKQMGYAPISISQHKAGMKTETQDPGLRRARSSSRTSRSCRGSSRR